MAKELDIAIHIHVAETKESQELSSNAMANVPCLSRRTGLFRSSVCLCSWVRAKRENERLATSHVAIAHNPISNLKLASGIAPIIQLQKAGVAVGIATARLLPIQSRYV